jgi:hypothetical protein
MSISDSNPEAAARVPVAQVEETSRLLSEKQQRRDAFATFAYVVPSYSQIIANLLPFRRAS